MKKMLYPFCALLMLFIQAKAQPKQSWQNAGNPGFSAGVAQTPAMAISPDGIPYVVFQDGINGPVTVMKLQDGKWVTVGKRGFSAGTATFPCIVINKNGVPYVAYADSTDTARLTVMKLSGSAWEPVDTPYCSKGSAQNIAMALDTNGRPYVFFQDRSIDSGIYSITVMAYDGVHWHTVGQRGFLRLYAPYCSIAIDAANVPYIAYQDGLNGPATVRKFDTGSWVPVGYPGFSAGRAKYITMALDRKGMPYVAYEDGGNTFRATVMRYTDSAGWFAVGQVGCSAGQAYYVALALDSNDVPYVAYSDNSDSNKATVMRYNNTFGLGWETVGPKGFSADWVWSASIAIDKQGTPYVAYSDLAYEYRATVMKMVPYPAEVAGIAGHEVFSVYPNPGNGSFTVYTSFTPGNGAMITVTDALGHIVQQCPATGTTTQVRLQVPRGTYYISMMAGHDVRSREIIVR